MAIELDRDELDLYLWNDSQCYFTGLETARAHKAARAPSDARWSRLYATCLARYRADIGPARPVKGLKAEMVPALKKDFLDHLAECDEHEARKSAEAHLSKGPA